MVPWEVFSLVLFSLVEGNIRTFRKTKLTVSIGATHLEYNVAFCQVFLAAVFLDVAQFSLTDGRQTNV